MFVATCLSVNWGGVLRASQLIDIRKKHGTAEMAQKVQVLFFVYAEMKFLKR
jgi:hypothetical protein